MMTFMRQGPVMVNHMVNCIGLRRQFHSTGLALLPKSFPQKYLRLHNRLDSIDKTNAIPFLQDCKRIQDELTEGSKFDSKDELDDISKLTSQVLLQKVQVDVPFLREYWLTFPNFQDLIISIDAFYTQNRRKVIPKEVVLIPFRKLVFDGAVSEAVKLVDSTVSSARYLKHKEDERVKNFLRYAGSFFGVIGAVELTIRAFGSHLANEFIPVYFAALAYVGNMSFLASMAFSRRKTDNHLRFDNGTFQKYWYVHADELQLLDRVMEADLKINDKEQSGFASKEFVDTLIPKKIITSEPEQEIIMRQYWLNGGDGFIWVEPDRDPADLIWEKNLQRLKRLELPRDRKAATEDMTKFIQ